MIEKVIYVIIYMITFASRGLTQRHPTISFITKERIRNIGDKVELECTVQYAQDYSVVWLQTNPENPADQTFISSGTHQIIPGSRYAISYDDLSGTYKLTIYKLQETDAGYYECQVIIGPTHKIRAHVWVYVRVPPVISDNSTRSAVTSTGSTIQLSCYTSTGFPLPRISWRREHNELLPNGAAMHIGNVLEFRNVSKDDRGTYYCVADNGVGKGARRHISVEVEFAPHVTAQRIRYGQALQYDQILECHIEAFPSPSVTWIKDGIVLNDNQHYQISIYPTADEFTDTTLRIITAEKRQYGFYTCQASNKLGSHEKIIEFFETPNVICPPACDAEMFLSGVTSMKPSCLIMVLCAIVIYGMTK